MPDLEVSIHRASGGDREALQELVVAHLDDIERFIRRRTGDRFLGKESLADLVQSAAREALAHLSTVEYQGVPAFVTWLYRIALTKIVQKHRYHHADRRTVRREAQPDPDVLLSEVCAEFRSPSQQAIAKELQQRFTAAFARLSPKHQEIFFLARVLELPHAQIAAHLGKSAPACRNMLVRAVSKLGALLGTDTLPD
jgi:RNA polymerase sigma factor (sigma-70 family)